MIRVKLAGQIDLRPGLERHAQRDPALAKLAREATQRALSRVIYGNFTGQGPYNPRPIATHSSPSARRFRTWVTQTHGSSRARRASGQSLKDRTRDQFVLSGVREAHPSRYAAAQEKVSASRPPSPSGTQVVRQRLARGLSARAKKGRMRRARVAAMSAGRMRFGVQTGRLARAWYDLRVRASRSGSGLSLSVRPGRADTPNTPDAERLTGILQRRSHWNGLLDTAQLIDALRDEGVIALD